MATTTPSNRNVKLGRGSILFDPFDANGVRTGFRHLGNCDSLTLGIETQTIVMKDYTQETSANYDETIVETNVNVGISGFEFDPFNLLVAFLGEEAAYSQAGGAKTEIELVPASATGVKGKFFEVGERNISLVTLTQGANTLVAGTDYELFDAAAGVIRILPTSPTVVDGSAIEIDYTAAEITAQQALSIIRGAVKAETVGQLLFLPKNAKGPRQECRIWKVNLRPNGEIGLISDEYQKWQVQGKALSDAEGAYGGSAANPYFQLLTRAAA